MKKALKLVRGEACAEDHLEAEGDPVHRGLVGEAWLEDPLAEVVLAQDLRQWVRRVEQVVRAALLVLLERGDRLAIENRERKFVVGMERVRKVARRVGEPHVQSLAKTHRIDELHTALLESLVERC